MRFAIAIALFAAAQSIVSAIPIRERSTEVAGVPHHHHHPADHHAVKDLDEEPVELVSRQQHSVRLHRSNMGTEHEHWSLHVHPTNQAGPGHIVDAVSNRAHSHNGVHGVLETDTRHVPNYDPHRAASDGSHHHHIGTFPTQAAAHAALGVMQGTHLSQQYANHNCVDWTHHAVGNLVAGGHLDGNSHGVQQFNQIYHNNQAAVRTNTDTAANRRAAGAINNRRG